MAEPVFISFKKWDYWEGGYLNSWMGIFLISHKSPSFYVTRSVSSATCCNWPRCELLETPPFPSAIAPVP